MPSTLSRVTRLRREPASARGGCAARLAGARRAERLRDLHRHQALVAQAVDDLRLVRRLELAARHVAGGD